MPVRFAAVDTDQREVTVQRFSFLIEVGRKRVAAVLEEPSSVLRSHRIQCPPHGLDQGLAGSCSCPPQKCLHLRERLLDGVSMRRHILSRANVVASGNSVEPTPLSAAFPSALRVGQLQVARCSMGSVRGGAAI